MCVGRGVLMPRRLPQSSHMRGWLRVLLGLAALSVPVIGSAQVAAPHVTIQTGRVRGQSSDDGRLDIFRGIPFAAPPVGALRWRAPRPAHAWRGTLDATRFSADCMQVPAKQGDVDAEAGRRFAEDCLYLNIWKPRAAAMRKLPILVWIYGGSFTHGGASQRVFDGARLAARGVVVVTFNYRLGPLGWLAHPGLTREAGTSGNYGLLDQIAVLRWLRDNGAAFGGDPAQITVAGESAGAISITALMTAPGAKGLFARAIVQSGPAWGMSARTRSRQDLEALGLRMTRRRGLRTIAQMRALPASDWIEATPEEAGPLIFPFAPIADGVALPVRPAEAFAVGAQARIPLIIGYTADEFSAFVPERFTPDMLVAQLRQDYGDDAERQIAFYPHVSPADARRSRIQSKAYPIHEGSIGQATWHARCSPSYVYRFDRVPPIPGSRLAGAAHGYDVPFTFDAVHDDRTPWEADDRSLGDAMATYWTNFAKTGDPNGVGVPLWPRFDPRVPMLMSLDTRPTAMPVTDLARIRAARRPADAVWLNAFATARSSC